MVGLFRLTCSCLAPGLAAEVETDLLARQQAVVSLTSVARPAHADICNMVTALTKSLNSFILSLRTLIGLCHLGS